MRFLNRDITYTWAKENIGMIVLMPTFVGGFWQMMELAWLDTSYVRFFSLSQLASDGLLVLFVLLIYAIAARIVYGLNAQLFRRLIFNKSIHPNEKPEEFAEKSFFYKDHNDDKSYRLFSWIFLFVLIGAAIYLLYPFDFNKLDILLFSESIIKPSTILIIIIVFGSLFILINGVVNCILTISGYGINVHNKVFRNRLKKFVSVILPAFFLYMLVKIPILFHNSFLMPENLKNKACILDQVKLTNPKPKTCKIAYFNDKFVFVSVIDSIDKEHIEILQFDQMFSCTRK